MSGKMVLSDELLVVYENIKLDYRKYNKKYKKLMRKLVLPYETNKAQIVRAKEIGLDEAVYYRLLPSLANNSNRNDSLEMLAETTSLKLILTEDENVELPYINYKSNFANKELSIYLKSDDSRGPFVRYLQFLCANARKITICDNYFAYNWDNTRSLFNSILPRNRLSIEYVETHSELTVIRNSELMTQEYISTVFNQWTVTKSNLYTNSHDRYLRIESPEGTIEVMISSGFDHIWKNNPKEITCVIRDITTN
ncbi:hypothetical protein [Proteus faecis]|uniref:hypothetical protein n=1 Tax=Proteus faecis TaxID=2050967 RepID=UPI003075B910